jgi:hypothetical protein
MVARGQQEGLQYSRNNSVTQTTMLLKVNRSYNIEYRGREYIEKLKLVF